MNILRTRKMIFLRGHYEENNEYVDCLNSSTEYGFGC